MKSPIYKNFTAIDGTKFSFESYMEFSVWYFSIPYRRIVAAFDAVTFKALQYAATKSKEARTPMIR